VWSRTGTHDVLGSPGHCGHPDSVDRAEIRTVTEPQSKTTVRVLDELDTRTLEYSALKRWQENLIKDLGGEKVLSSLQRELIEQATRVKVVLDRVDRPRLPKRAPEVGTKAEAVRSGHRRLLVTLLKMLGAGNKEAPVPTTSVPGKKTKAVPTLDELRRRR